MSQTEALLDDIGKIKTSNPISNYNQVVDFYNKQSGSSIQLVYLDESMFYMKFHSIHKKIVGKILLVLCLIVPLINLLVMFNLVKCLIFLKNQMKKVRRNSIMVPNPFTNFHKDNDLCNQLGTHCSSVALSIKQLEGFTFNRQISKGFNQAGRMRVNIYDDEFEEYYFGMNKAVRKMLIWVVIGACETVGSTVLLAVLVSR